jgi:hypothetical protein
MRRTGDILERSPRIAGGVLETGEHFGGQLRILHELQTVTLTTYGWKQPKICPDLKTGRVWNRTRFHFDPSTSWTLTSTLKPPLIFVDRGTSIGCKKPDEQKKNASISITRL